MNRSRPVLIRRSVALGGLFGLASCHADALFKAPVQLALYDTWGNEATDLH